MIRTIRARAGALGALALVGALALTACSSEAPAAAEPDADAAAESYLPAAEGTTAYPLELDSPWGSTTLEERPERIAAITPSQDDVEALAAIGVTPVLANEYSTDVWTARALTQEIPERYSTGDTDFPVEQIAAADPDLIIVLGADVSADYEKLAAIAPVLSTSESNAGEASVANDWETSLTAIGEALDLQAAAEEALATEEQFFTDFRAEHPEFDGLTASYVVYYGAESGLQYHSTAGSPAGSTLEQMGFATNPNAAGLEYRAAVSNEMLSAIDADVIIFSDNSGGSYAEVTDSPLFQGLSAAQSDHVILIDNQATEGVFVIDGVEHEGNLPWGLARSGPLSATWAAEQLAPALSATLAE
ncbi:ABC transporter substrate-binding protein [Microbacterium sp. NPDC055903]